VIFNDRIGDVAEKFLRKGSKVYVEGSLQTRKWTDQAAQERYTTEVVIGRFRGELTMLSSSGGEGTDRDRGTAPASAPAGGDLYDDDDIPF
jgi:single-strand DNA-binding protein